MIITDNDIIMSKEDRLAIIKIERTQVIFNEPEVFGEYKDCNIIISFGRWENKGNELTIDFLLDVNDKEEIIAVLDKSHESEDFKKILSYVYYISTDEELKIYLKLKYGEIPDYSSHWEWIVDQCDSSEWY